ncbi:MAG: LuxR family transcriptional regulator [Coriobacteriales bacterium]|jgi:DNA-binding CsgD family transcriptional regulator/tetratricopeptide (TPR) repeat protein|nr:LuxR family transcriptional regulator [Coriobacteriales bacterium]
MGERERAAVSGRQIREWAAAGDYQAIIAAVNRMPTFFPGALTSTLLEVFQNLAPQTYKQLPQAFDIGVRAAFSQGRINDGITYLKKLIEKFRRRKATPLRDRILCDAHNNLGLGLIINAPFSKRYTFAAPFKSALDYFETGYQLPHQGAINSFSLGPYANRVGSEFSGNFSAYADQIEDSIIPLSRTRAGCMKGLDRLLKAELAYFKADLDLCINEVNIAIRTASLYLQYEIRAMGLFYLLRAYTAKGDQRHIRDIIKTYEQSLDEIDNPNRYIYYDLSRGWYYATIGQMEKVPEWISAEFSQDRRNRMTIGLADVIKSRYLLGRGEPERMLAFLESVRANPFGPTAFVFGRIGLYYNSAIAHLNLGHHDEAMQDFLAAYRAAEPEGLYMLFYEYGNATRKICTCALEQDLPIPHQWLVHTRSKAQVFARHQARLRNAVRGGDSLDATSSNRLTSREVAVLEDLVAGLTRPQVASKYHLSINTVKSNLAYTMQKLGALNLLDAVRIATKFGYLN